MPNYTVRIDERISHTVDVDADTESEAVDLAHNIVANYSEADLKESNNYTVESEGFTGYYYVEENK